MLLINLSLSTSRGKDRLVARISGVTIPDNKQVWVSLTYIYGIGPKSAKDILTKARVEETTRTKDLNDQEISRIQEAINADYIVEGELQRIVTGNIKRLKDIKSYRGQRHTLSLPTRGQRTKTNARTKRGRKVTVGGTAKKVASKT
ncbi:MAG TPA: 30S ribosomal protein S13 [Candidatus Sulfotelmatobacter sp.]|nr:30S ribosomal protein S13 [Candidatus Sulfotelmatobacter sp.]